MASGSLRAESPRYKVHGAHGRWGTDPPGWLHQWCTRLHGRSAADAGMGHLMVQIKGN